MVRKVERRSISIKVETQILTQSARRCALCYGLRGDLNQKRGQIAHIDRDPSNSEEANLVFLCVEHHDEYDSRTSQSKSLTKREVLEYKARLIGEMSLSGSVKPRHEWSDSQPSEAIAAPPTDASVQGLLTPLPAVSADSPAFVSREEAYQIIPEVIYRLNREQRGPKELLLAALHGHSGDRVASQRSKIQAFRSFDEAILGCIRSVGPGMWKVRELFNITSESRLEEILRWFRRSRGADGYEARSFCVPDTIPTLAPLVISDCDAFLGFEDSRYYRVRGSVHVHGEKAVSMISGYFNSLWNDRRVIVLRPETGVDETAVERLRALIISLRRESPMDGG
jgi:hypothetical protein